MKEERFDEQGASRGFYSHHNRLNDLTGREWVFWTRSVITKPYPPSCQHRLRRQHGGQKPPELCADLIRVFTKAGQSVLDPFMGVGGTLLGAAQAGREGVGIEINPRWIEIYKEVCRREGLKKLATLTGDARCELEGLAGERFHMILTDVPYWTMDRAPRSPGAFKRAGQPAQPPRASRLSRFNDLAYASKEEWLQAMDGIFRSASGLLLPGGYLLTFIGDMYFGDRYHCLSSDLAQRLAAIPGLTWKADLIWYDVSKKLHLYGYQYAYIPSMIHQSILVFRKESSIL